MRLRYDDTTTHSTTTEVIEITICVRFDCDATTTRLRRKIDMFILPRRMETGARDTSYPDRSRMVSGYDTTTTRRYHDAFDYDGSDRNYDSTAIRLRSDYDV